MSKHITLNSLLLAAIVSTVTGCTSSGEVKTLRSLDVRQGQTAGNEVFVKPKSEEEVKAAYYDYIANGTAGESSRLLAIHRLAEMEIDRLNDLLKTGHEVNREDEVYRASLERTRDLLQTSLDEFPDARHNDEALYQLAQTHELLGDPGQSLAALGELVRRYPESRHYPEAQFRLGEAAFVMGDYIAAEDAYSEALFSDESRSFFERSMFKRGWSRYKQGLYIEAADDYLAALKARDFADYEALPASEKDELDEYFRAIGLAFANLQNLEILQNFFVDGADHKYLYHVYRAISDTYLEQERFSDAAGVMAQFVALNPASPDIPLAKLKIVAVWQLGGFRELFNHSLEDVYQSHHPGHAYWDGHSGQQDSTIKSVSQSLRDYAAELAAYHHGRYQRSRSGVEFERAELWYRRYLDHFSAYARQDKIYNGYAELLADREQNERALHYFELAAYDGDIILDKDAAYASIVLSNQLYLQEERLHWLDKQLQYALSSARLYSTEALYQNAALNAAELAFHNQRYAEAIALANVLPDSAAAELHYQAGVLKGLAYTKSGEPAQAEAVFAGLLAGDLTSKQRREQQDNLAIAIYQQAEIERNAEKLDSAIGHFARIPVVSPESPIAATALYEALVLAMNHAQWNKAIQFAEHFQARYADHKLSQDVGRHLSAAYLEAGDKVKAAQAFEQLANEDNDQQVKMAALWQAAELYESRNDLDSAIRSYRSYAHTYPRPYPQNLEAMHKLTGLYERTGDSEKRRFWLDRIAEADQKTDRSLKTSRTNQIAASVLLELAHQKAEEFRQRKLVAPLADNLRIKKGLLQESTVLFGRASAYSLPGITTEATYSIGRLYQEFSRALLESERPPELQGEELAQYDILLEDQAFPFEEKAIEFYETNLARTSSGIADQWIVESYRHLAGLFPARYDRKGKLGIYVDGTH
jgi:tetratricopeptide (TPR) repeat protein